MNKLLIRYDKKLKQVLDWGGMGWEDTFVDDLTKITVVEDFALEDIKFSKEIELKGVVVYYDIRMEQKEIDKALIEFYANKMSDYLGQTNFIRGTHGKR